MKKMNKKTLVLLIAIAALMTASIGGTVAWLATSSGPITNTFTPAHVSVSVTDEIDGNTKENVQITNTSDIPVYMRVAVVANWYEGEDANKKIVAPWNDYRGFAAKVSGNWEQDGNYFYYKGTVAAKTPVELFKNGEGYSAVNNTDYPNAHLEMDIIAQVIQATPTDAVTAAWGFVPGTTN